SVRAPERRRGRQPRLARRRRHGARLRPLVLGRPGAGRRARRPVLRRAPRLGAAVRRRARPLPAHARPGRRRPRRRRGNRRRAAVVLEGSATSSSSPSARAATVPLPTRSTASEVERAVGAGLLVLVPPPPAGGAVRSASLSGADVAALPARSVAVTVTVPFW